MGEGDLEVVAEELEDADDVFGVGGLGRVAEVTGEAAGVLGEVQAPGEVLGGGCEESGDPQAAGAFGGRLGVGVEGAVEPVAALAGAPQACQ